MKTAPDQWPVAVAERLRPAPSSQAMALDRIVRDAMSPHDHIHRGARFGLLALAALDRRVLPLARLNAAHPDIAIDDALYVELQSKVGDLSPSALVGDEMSEDELTEASEFAFSYGDTKRKAGFVGKSLLNKCRKKGLHRLSSSPVWVVLEAYGDWLVCNRSELCHRVAVWCQRYPMARFAFAECRHHEISRLVVAASNDAEMADVRALENAFACRVDVFGRVELSG